MLDPSPTATKEQLIEWFKEPYLKENSGVDVAGELKRIRHEQWDNFNFWRDIIFALIKTGVYALHIHDGRWIVYPNPEHALSQSVKATNDSVKRTNTWMTILTLAIVGISLAGFIAQLRSKEGIDIETQRILQEQSQELRNIQLSLERINISMNRIFLDTSNRNNVLNALRTQPRRY